MSLRDWNERRRKQYAPDAWEFATYALIVAAFVGAAALGWWMGSEPHRECRTVTTKMGTWERCR